MSYDVCPASDLITQGFGCSTFASEWIAPWCPTKRYHSGIDLGMVYGSLFRRPVFATRSGVVVAVGQSGDVDTGFWTYLGTEAVCLKTSSAYILYAHLDSANVKVGATVQGGQIIGFVGTRGNSTGPHLHLEVRTDGARQNVWNNASAVLDPRPYLNDLVGGTAGSEIQVGGAMTLEEYKGQVILAYLVGLGRTPENQAAIDSWANKMNPTNFDQKISEIVNSTEGIAYRAKLAGTSAVGPAGPQGPPGPKGDPGTAAPSLLHHHTTGDPIP